MFAEDNAKGRKLNKINQEIYKILKDGNVTIYLPASISHAMLLMMIDKLSSGRLDDESKKNLADTIDYFANQMIENIPETAELYVKLLKEMIRS